MAKDASEGRLGFSFIMVKAISLTESIMALNSESLGAGLNSLNSVTFALI